MGQCCEGSSPETKNEVKVGGSNIDRRPSHDDPPQIKAETFRHGSSQGSPEPASGSSYVQPALFCKRGTNDIIMVEKRGETKSVERISASVSSDDWVSVQVHRRDLGAQFLFQVRDGAPGCRWIDSNGRVTEEKAHS